MNIFNWLKSRFSRRDKLLPFYRRAKKHDHQGGIDDDSVSHDRHADASMNVKAMALFNRALVHVASGDFTRGVADLDTVLAMNEAPGYVKKMARQRLAKRESRLRKANA